MSALIDLTGQRFGKLVVIGRNESKKYKNRPLWQCKCDCGNITNVPTSALRSGNTKSCGCGQREKLAERNRLSAKHGAKRIGNEERLYNIWEQMRYRCQRKSHEAYKYYGAKGIKVCDEWETDYAAFKKWAEANGYKDNLSIDRIDSSGDYCPQNCRWANAKTQANNRTNNVLITYKGKTQTVTEWSEETGLSRRIIDYRLNAGWEVPRIFEQPGKRKRS